MPFTVITTYEEFLTLEQEWNRLLSQQSESSIFDTFEWNQTWLKHFHRHYQLHCLVISNSQNRVTAILPLIKAQRRYHLLGLHDRDQSRLLGNLSTEELAAVLSSLRSQIYTHIGLFHLRLDDAWKIYFALRKMDIECEIIMKKELFVATQTFDVSQLQNAKEIQKKIKKLREQGTLEYITLQQPTLPEWFLSKLRDWERTRYRTKGYTPRFSLPSYQQWLTEMFASQKIPMFANALMLNHEPLSIQWGYINGKKEYLLHSHVFNETFYRQSPGIIGIVSCIQSARHHNAAILNFGPGEMAYKKIMTDDYSVRADLIIPKNTLVSSLRAVKSFAHFIKHKTQRSLSKPTNQGESNKPPLRKWIYSLPGVIFQYRQKHNHNDINVLCYHKVSDFDHSFLSVGVRRFYHHMNYLKRHYTILRLSEMSRLLHQGTELPPNAIAITFDDGYRDNYEFVFPIIQHLNIPIAIFLCGAYVKKTKREECVPEQADTIIPTPDVVIQKNKESRDRPHDWKFYPWDDEKEHIMTIDQIRKMLETGLVEFYPHTMTHPILTTISLDEARKEILESKRWIENLLADFQRDGLSLSYTPDIFAYPSGNPGVDFTPEHEQIVRDAGFQTAFSLRRASSRRTINFMNVERRMVLNEPLALFKLRITGYFDNYEFPPNRTPRLDNPGDPKDEKDETQHQPQAGGASLAKHTFIQTMGRALSLVISALTIPIMTRYFGPEQYGFLTTALSFLYFFGILSEFGFYNLVSREMPIRKGRDQELFFGNVLGLKLAFAILATVAASSIIWMTHYPLSIKLIVVIASSAFSFQSFIYVFGAFLQYRLNTAALAMGDVLNKIGIGIFAILTYLFHLPITFFVMGYLAGTALNIAAVFHSSRKLLPLSFRFDGQEWKKLLQNAMPFWILSLITFVYFRADSLILGLYHNQTDVGLYGAAYKLLEVLISFPTLFTGLLLPLLSSSFTANNIKVFSSLFQKGFDSLAFFVFPMMTFVLCNAPFVIHLVAGDEFLRSAPILRILIIATGAIFFAHLTTAGVVATNSQQKMVPLSAMGAIGALALYLALIPRFSYFGAAWTTLIVESFVLCASFYLVREKTHISLSFKRSGLFLFSAILATISFLLVPATDIPSFILGSLLFGIIYLMSAFITKALEPSFFHPIKSLTQKDINT